MDIPDISQTSSEVNHALETVKLLCHLGNLVLHQGVLGEVQSKLLPGVAVLHRVVEQRPAESK